MRRSHLGLIFGALLWTGTPTGAFGQHHYGHGHYHHGHYHGGGSYGGGFYGGGYSPYYGSSFYPRGPGFGISFGFGPSYYPSYYGSYYGSGLYLNRPPYADPYPRYYPAPAYSVIPAPRPAHAPAFLTVIVPADATVLFDGQPTVQTGPSRLFRTAALEPGWDYQYEVRARWMQDGQPVERVRVVTFHAGDQFTVDLTARPQAPASN